MSHVDSLSHETNRLSAPCDLDFGAAINRVCVDKIKLESSSLRSNFCSWTFRFRLTAIEM